MKLNILCDAHWESRLDKFVSDLSSSGYRNFFNSRDYGSGLNGIVIVLMCRSQKFKQRIRLMRKENMLYVDIMFDLDSIRLLGNDARRQIAVNRLADEVPEVLYKLSIPDFNREQFVTDFKNWLSKI